MAISTPQSSEASAAAGSAPAALPAAALYRRCDPATLAFTSTDELPEQTESLGQERALAALRFGTGIRREGFNLFALGPAGVGKHQLVQRFLQERAAAEAVPPDLCYINNFSDPQKPRALRLPPGRGAPLARDMERLVNELRVAIPAIFETEDYRTRKALIDKELDDLQARTFDAFEQRAAERGISVVRTPGGVALGPLRDGEVLGDEEFAALPDEERRRVQADIDALQAELQESLQAAPRWNREHWKQVEALDRELTTHAVSHLIDELRPRYSDLPEVLTYLAAVQEDVVDNVSDFLPPDEGDDEDSPAPTERPTDATRRYKVNVLLDHGADRGAPVVYEDHPTHSNLIGRVEHQAQFGALITDFNLIRPGALHRANGGYLIIDARRLLQQHAAWAELKRTLRSKEVRIQPPEESGGPGSTLTLEPEAVPLSVKVVLLGERHLYYALAARDPDFPALFKVAVDFEEFIPRSAESDLRYAQLLGTMARREGLRPLSPAAVARIIEHAARLCEDAERLTTHLRSLADVLREADHYAADTGSALIGLPEVEAAIQAQIGRVDRLRGEMLEEVRRGVVVIETRGARVGQVNGLTVTQLGQFCFGRPVRVTARVRPGRGEVADIERKVALGGPLHSKGVLILSAYLGSRYTPDRTFGLTASVVLEQSYGGVEGDSASAAELCALLSALADAPLRQGLAITGSVSQHGEIQAIGGVNEKIEGFYDTCLLRGLTGEEGVLIPAANARHLMLREDLVAAAAAGRFHVYPVATVDQAIALLCGTPAGERDASGAFPAGSLNRRIEARLLHYSRLARPWRALEGEDEGGLSPGRGP